MDRLKQIEREMRALRAEENEINNANFMQEAEPIFKTIVGKCFVYRGNCYSCLKPNERWDTLRQVIKFKRGDGCGIVVFLSCEIDYLGRVQIIEDYAYVNRYNQIPNIFGEGWAPCSVTEFNVNYKRALGQIKNPTLTMKYLRSEQ